jgi:hypothetical protein
MKLREVQLGHLLPSAQRDHAPLAKHENAVALWEVLLLVSHQQTGGA